MKMESLSTLNPVFYKEIKDESIGLRGYIVIDKHINGLATGGVRMAEDLTLEEVANLAREMTLKFSFLNIKKDGAKAGIAASAQLPQEKKRELCLAFGRAIADLIKTHKYSPGEDLGINAADLSNILRGMGINTLKNNHVVKSEYFTALTVFLSAKSLFEYHNLELKDCSVIVEGFGKVAEQALKMFADANAKIIGISTLYGAIFDEAGLDIEEIIRLKKLYGDSFINFCRADTIIEKEALLEKTADILIPGARPDSINFKNVNKIRAKAVVPIANIAVEEEIENILFKRQVIYIPGFVSNCGGILGHFLNEQNFNNSEIELIIRNGFPEKLNRLIQESKEKNVPIAYLARKISSENLQNMELENKLSSYKKLYTKKVIWLLYKFFAKFKAGFCLKSYAKRYIQNIIFN